MATMTLQELVNAYSYEKIHPLLQEELNKLEVTTFLPKPSLPQVLSQNVVGGQPYVAFSGGEPVLNSNVELENTDQGVLRSLFLFFTLWANYVASKLAVVDIEVMLLKEQQKRLESGMSIKLKNSGIPAGMLKDYVNVDSEANVVNIAVQSRLAVKKIMSTRYDCYRRLLNSISRESTARSNFNEYTNQGESGHKWKASKKGHWGKNLNMRT